MKEVDHAAGIASRYRLVKEPLSDLAPQNVTAAQPFQPTRIPIDLPPIQHRLLERLIEIAFRLSSEPRPRANARAMASLVKSWRRE